MQYDMMLPQEEEEENDISGRRPPLAASAFPRDSPKSARSLEVEGHSFDALLRDANFFPKDKIFSGLPLLRKTKDLSCAISNFWWFDLMELTTFQLKGITLFL